MALFRKPYRAKYEKKTSFNYKGLLYWVAVLAATVVSCILCLQMVQTVLRGSGMATGVSSGGTKDLAIMDRYDMAFDNQLNTVDLKGHRGRHTNAYHEFMLCTLISLDYMAAGSKELFYEGMKIIGDFILDNIGLPYAK